MNKFPSNALACFHPASRLPLVRRLTLCASLAAWLIVSIAPSGASETQFSEAVEVFRCSFDEQWDLNYDRWPDRWERETGTEYAHYVQIDLLEQADAAGGQCLAIGLDGASAAISSPPIRVMSRFSYMLEARLKTENLDHSHVMISIRFYDSEGNLLQTAHSELLTGSSDWRNVRLGSVDPISEAIDRAVVEMKVMRGTTGDLNGRVLLDEVWLSRLPRITVSTNSASNVYTDPNEVMVDCELSGIREQTPEIRFQLLDAYGNELTGDRSKLAGRLIVQDGDKVSGVVDGVSNAPAGYEGSSEWWPEIPGYGYYQLAVTMLSSVSGEDKTEEERRMDSRVIYLAVVPPLDMPKYGEFGWTIPNADDPLSFQELSQLLPNVGINWLKVPVWFDGSRPHRGDEIVRFVELLGASNIEVVGILDKAPEGTELHRRAEKDSTIADLLANYESVWLPSLDPVMTRLSLRVRWWQLGSDRDTSFVGYPDLRNKIEDLRGKLYRFGQDVRLGLGWEWESADMLAGKVSWEFEQYSSAKAMTAEKLEKMLSVPQPNSSVRWVLVDPPPPVDDPALTPTERLEARVSEFLRQIIVAKDHGVEAIYISNPFDDDSGIMRSSGMPGELLLPWRTAGAMLGGGELLGSLELPNGSENRVFLRHDGQVVMVVWNDEPTEEALYLGPDVKQVNIWGQAAPAPMERHRHLISVGPVPTFVIGLHEAITRWRMSVRLDQERVPSVFAVPHPNSVHFTNHFPFGVGGTLSISIPENRKELASDKEETAEYQGFDQDRWSIEMPQGTFRLAKSEDTTLPFEVRLKNAEFGNHRIRVDVEVNADEHYEFSVYRDMHVGMGDIEIEVYSFLDDEGALVVKQIMVNHGEQLVDFKCYLYAKGHRRRRMQVYRLGEDADTKTYRFPGGANLVGQELLLEVEEVNGPRVYKYRFLGKAVSDIVEETEEPFEE